MNSNEALEHDQDKCQAETLSVSAVGGKKYCPNFQHIHTGSCLLTATVWLEEYKQSKCKLCVDKQIGHFALFYRDACQHEKEDHVHGDCNINHFWIQGQEGVVYIHVARLLRHLCAWNLLLKKGTVARDQLEHALY